MHEYSIASALLRQVEKAARPHPGAKVRRVRVAIGELAGVEVALLATAFTALRPETPCAEAELVIDARPARWACPVCNDVIRDGEALCCPSCATPARLDSGGEILLQGIDLEIDVEKEDRDV